MHGTARRIMGIVAVVMVSAWATRAVSQEPPNWPVLASGGSQVVFGASTPAPDSVLLVPQQAAVDRKDPAVAGVLSFLITGLGSIYAGNAGHGILHLGIGLGAYAVMMAGVNADACQYGDDCSTAEIGAVLYLGNAVWSIFTAVSDAKAHNAAAGGPTGGRVVGSLYVDPQVRVLGSRSVGGVSHARGMSRTGLQLLSLRF